MLAHVAEVHGPDLAAVRIVGVARVAGRAGQGGAVTRNEEPSAPPRILCERH